MEAKKDAGSGEENRASEEAANSPKECEEDGVTLLASHALLRAVLQRTITLNKDGFLGALLPQRYN